MHRLGVALFAATMALVVGAPAALACGGLIGPNGAVNLLRTTTLAGYHDGVEHYVTSFEFAGGGAEVGSIVPLPDIPSKVERGGDWTLQRLVREVRPPVAFAAEDAALRATAAPAEELLNVRIDALDLTVLRGGADAVVSWAVDHGFVLPDDAPEMLGFYAERSPIFLAARFDAQAATERGTGIGDGTPVHLTIPTDNPWVPLRILALGREPVDLVQADVFLLTDRRPSLLPLGIDAPGLALQRQERASSSLLSDLRSDKGMDWVPNGMWLSHLELDARAGDLVYDLAIDATGLGTPDLTDTGLTDLAEELPAANRRSSTWPVAVVVGFAAAAGLLAVGAGAMVTSRRRGPAGG